MSYILDALKKSEQERQSNSTIPLQPSPPAKRFAPELSTSNILSIVMLLALLILGAYYFINSEPFEPNVTIEPIVVEEPKRVRPVSANLVAPANPEPEQAYSGEVDKEIADLYSAADNSKPVTRRKAAPASTPSRQANASPKRVSSGSVATKQQEPAQKLVSEPVAPKVVSIPLMNDISWAVKGEIPSVDYSAHIYAQDSSKGFVILNGAKKHAGDKLRNGIFVEQIEEDNVVLSFKGVIFKLPAMKSWKNK